MADPGLRAGTRRRSAAATSRVLKGRPKEAARPLPGGRPAGRPAAAAVREHRLGAAPDAPAARTSIAAYDEALRRAPDDAPVAQRARPSALAAAGRRATRPTRWRVAPVEVEEMPPARRARRRRLHDADGARRGARRRWPREGAAPATSRRAVERLRRGRRRRLCQQRASSTPRWTPACGPWRRSRARRRVHLQMARLYFQRGWTELAVERLLLLDRLLEPRRRSAPRARPRAARPRPSAPPSSRLARPRLIGSPRATATAAGRADAGRDAACTARRREPSPVARLDADGPARRPGRGRRSSSPSRSSTSP